LVVAGSTLGAESSPRQFFASATPVYQGGADLDRGGDFSMSGLILRGGTAYDFGGGKRARVTLSYDYLNYSFSNASAFGWVAPWNVVQRYGVAVPLSFRVGDDWSLGFAPSADWVKENGANAGDSLVWGATFSGVKKFEGGNLLGLGAGVFYRIEKTSAFPFLIVDWRIDGNRTAGIGAAYRSPRFRLSDSGPVRNGVGEERGVPVFVHVTRRLGNEMALHFYGGVVAGGSLRVENSSGDQVQKEDFDPAPLLGLTLSGRF
jgi:hypothetical protein